MYPTISIFEIRLSTYYVFIFLAMFAFIVNMKYLIIKNNIKYFEFSYYISFIFVSGFLGSKLFYLIEDFKFSYALQKITNFKNGYVLYGGLLCVFICSFFYAKYKKLDILLLLDHNAIALCLSISIGKVACLTSGCCYGIPTNLDSIGLVYTNALCIAYPKNEPLFPIQIIDSLFALILFVFFLGIKLRNKIRNGLVFFLFCLLYPTYRFFSEIYRGDTSRGFIFNGQLSLSQLYSILILLVSIFILIIYKFKSNKTKNVSN